MTPFFWPTKIRPSGANWTLLGSVKPVKTVTSLKPGARVVASGVTALVVVAPSPRKAGCVAGGCWTGGGATGAWASEAAGASSEPARATSERPGA